MTMMKARITYRMETTIEGNDLEEIMQEWAGRNLDPSGNSEFVELVSVNDAETNKDLSPYLDEIDY